MCYDKETCMQLYSLFIVGSHLLLGGSCSNYKLFAHSVMEHDYGYAWPNAIQIKGSLCHSNGKVS